MSNTKNKVVVVWGSGSKFVEMKLCVGHVDAMIQGSRAKKQVLFPAEVYFLNQHRFEVSRTLGANKKSRESKGTPECHPTQQIL